MSVGLSVRLGGLAGMVFGVSVMALRRLRVVGGLLVIARLVMLRGFLMVTGGVLVVLGSLMMMLGGFLGHDLVPLLLNDFDPECEEHIGRGVTAGCRIVELNVKR